MTNLTKSSAWQRLAEHYATMRDRHLNDLFAENPQRFNQFSLQAAGLFLDYSKNPVQTQTMNLLIDLAHTQGLTTAIAELFSGANVNFTEQRPALHTALRQQNNTPVRVAGHDIIPLIHTTLHKMETFCTKIHQRQYLGFNGVPIDTIVNIGIGGSDLGPHVVVEALKPYALPIQCHFISNIDGAQIQQTLCHLDPQRTLFLVSSKSFSTIETLKNANIAKQWLHNAFGPDVTVVQQHMIAITANTERALAFGITADNIFPIWDWVGGRFSLWSAIGLPVALSVGMTHFYDLLAGAAAMDQHFCSAPFSQNMPVILALLNIWHTDFFDCHSHAIIPYDENLRLLPLHLQQTIMESTGKSINSNGERINYRSGSVIWGTDGTNGQHAYYQLFHQGNVFIPIDFIVARHSHYTTITDSQTLLYANCLSQAQALMQGRTLNQAYQQLIANGVSERQAQQLSPHLIIPGNHSSNIIVLEKSTPQAIGALIALYEHKTYVESRIWDINCFDQWGVELGKQLAQEIAHELTIKQCTQQHDSSTQGLMELFINGK